MPDSDKMTPEEERALIALFEDARTQEPPVSMALLERISEDAAKVVPPAAGEATKRPPKNWFLELFGQLGGLPGASVMTACALFGLSLGYAGPDSLISVTGLTDLSFASSELDIDVDAFQTTGFEFDEGELLQ